MPCVFRKVSFHTLLALLLAASAPDAHCGAGASTDSAPAANADNTVALRGFAEMPTEAFAYLADVVEPVKFVAASDATPRQIITERCGDGTPPAAAALLEQKLRELNPGKIADGNEPVVLSGTELLVPFCTPIRTNTTVAYFENKAGLEGVIRSHYAVAGPVTQRRVMQQSAACEGRSPGACSRGLGEGDSLTLPYSSEWIAGQIKIGLSASTVIARLKELAPAYQPDIRENSSQASEAVSFIQQIDTSTPCGGDANASANWPFDQKLVWKQYSRMLEIYREKNPNAGVPQAHVALLDSGFGRQPFDSTFPLNHFRLNKQETSNDRDDDHNGIVDDLYGIGASVLPEGNIFAYTEDAYFNHGTQVASIALGGPGMMDATKSMQIPPIRISLLRVSRRHRPGLVTPEVTFIPIALQWVEKQDVAVLNVSLKHAALVEKYYASVYANTLIVAAAGNDADNLDDAPVRSYPAYAGGNAVIPVITVGAHDHKGVRLPKSNYSKNHVDLLAPGCAIASFNAKGETVAANGTSFAAPLVTFTAGLLRALGMDSGPRDIRNRILSATDFDPKLAEDVWSEGMLNIPKAVSIYADVIVIGSPVSAANTDTADSAEPELVFGEVKLEGRSMAEELTRFCSPLALRRKMNDAKIVKFSPFYDKDSNLRVRYLFDPDSNWERQLRKIECALNQHETKIMIRTPKDGGGHDTREIPINKVVDIVPRI